jgi:hypothetical protein
MFASILILDMTDFQFLGIHLEKVQVRKRKQHTHTQQQQQQRRNAMKPIISCEILKSTYHVIYEYTYHVSISHDM